MNQGMMRSRTLLLQLLLLTVLAACDSGERQRLQLEELERMNREYVPLTNDSLARDLADWFDRHGTRNEQLRAYYMLGRTYADRGEVPQALEAYHDAIDRADTTAQDCNYYTLCRLYSQMAEVFRQQNLFSDNLRCLNQSIIYAFHAGDTIAALNSYGQKAATFDMMDLPDSVIAYCLKTKKSPNIYNRYMALAANAYIRIGDLPNAHRCLDIYERESGYFVGKDSIEKGREAYYNIKGRYYFATGQLDSAEYFFRRIHNLGKSCVFQDMSARSLSLLYNRKRMSDSAVAYALYAYEMNDSVYSQMSTNIVARIQAMYDYSTHQHIAQQEKERADYERNKATSYLFILVLIVAIGGYIVYLQIKRRQAADTAYQNKVSELERVQNDVLLLRSQEEDKNAVLREKEEEMTNLQKELSVLRGKIEQISESAESQLLKNVGYKHLTDIAEAGKLMTEEDWRDVNKLVIDVLPEFSQYISNRKHSLNIVEYRTAILFRLHIRSKSIHYMLGISPQYVSKVKGQLCEKLFQNKMGSLKFLEEKLSEFN